MEKVYIAAKNFAFTGDEQVFCFCQSIVKKTIIILIISYMFNCNFR